MPDRPRTIGDLLAELPRHHAPRLHGCASTTPVVGLTADSRSVGPGGAFVALRGATHDGHAFVAAARARGASLCIVDHGRGDRGPTLELDDTNTALPVLAAAFHGWPGRALSLVGITGTNGKTTTAHLLAAVFRAADRLHLRLGTTGHFLVDHEVSASFTTPFPLELQALLADAVQRGAVVGVMEVSSHALVQDRVAPLRFRAAALTSFSQDHLDFHADMEDYLAAKLRLVRDHLASDGVAVAPVDEGDAGRRFLATARGHGARTLAVSHDAGSDADIFARAWSTTSAGLRAEVCTPRGDFVLESPLVGTYNLDNLLVTTGLALALDIDPKTIATGLRTSRGAPGRLERVALAHGEGPRVFVDYAHTPDAVARALAALRPTCRGHLVVLLGCGGDRDRAKRPLMARAALQGADRLIATSDNPRTEDPEVILDDMLAGAADMDRVERDVDRRRAIHRAVTDADPSDTILIAGKGHEDYQILGTTKIHFDDREEARAALEARAR